MTSRWNWRKECATAAARWKNVKRPARFVWQLHRPSRCRPQLDPFSRKDRPTNVWSILFIVRSRSMTCPRWEWLLNYSFPHVSRTTRWCAGQFDCCLCAWCWWIILIYWRPWTRSLSYGKCVNDARTYTFLDRQRNKNTREREKWKKMKWSSLFELSTQTT